ncbi:hypothetical protein [Bordetella bronchialis]|uniref:Uncharacterized protein n=1 Tax=Bordetella bronchialis TaxID=463025 RepID=A0A193FTG0_9BORD|nr:hypothetical protein [Bordetella bronchialis]ANN70925.1 hypothetical protein BAU08_05885 [Bordetella bronchialis]
MDQIYALVENGTVVNTVVWNGDTSIWSPPPGQDAILIKPEDGAVSIGWGYVDGKFVDPSGAQQA